MKLLKIFRAQSTAPSSLETRRHTLISLIYRHIAHITSWSPFVLLCRANRRLHCEFSLALPLSFSLSISFLSPQALCLFGLVLAVRHSRRMIYYSRMQIFLAYTHPRKYIYTYIHRCTFICISFSLCVRRSPSHIPDQL